MDLPVQARGPTAYTNIASGGTVYTHTVTFHVSSSNAKVLITAQMGVEVPSPTPSRVSSQIQLEDASNAFLDTSPPSYASCVAADVGCFGSYSWMPLWGYAPGDYVARLRIYCSGSNSSPKFCDTASVKGSNQVLTVQVFNP